MKLFNFGQQQNLKAMLDKLIKPLFCRKNKESVNVSQENSVEDTTLILKNEPIKDVPFDPFANFFGLNLHKEPNPDYWYIDNDDYDETETYVYKLDSLDYMDSVFNECYIVEKKDEQFIMTLYAQYTRHNALYLFSTLERLFGISDLTEVQAEKLFNEGFSKKHPEDMHFRWYGDSYDVTLSISGKGHKKRLCIDVNADIDFNRDFDYWDDEADNEYAIDALETEKTWEEANAALRIAQRNLEELMAQLNMAKKEVPIPEPEKEQQIVGEHYHDDDYDDYDLDDDYKNDDLFDHDDDCTDGSEDGLHAPDYEDDQDPEDDDDFIDDTYYSDYNHEEENDRN